MSRHLDIDLIRSFATVADLGSMTAAASMLNRTQGAISQQVKRLEDSLGKPLFSRERPGLRLTAAGERLLPQVRRLLALNDEIWTDMTAEPLGGTVRLGVPYDLVGTLMAPVLKAFAETCPAVEISLVCAASPDLLGLMAKGEVHLVLAEQPVDAPGGECLRLERLVWVGAKGGEAHRKSPLPLSMVADTCAFRPAVLAALESEGRRWRAVFESGNIEATNATVRADLAVTAWLACTIAPDLEILTPAHGLPELPPFAIALHRPPQGLSAAAEAMAHHIRNGLQRSSLAA